MTSLMEQWDCPARSVCGGLVNESEMEAKWQSTGFGGAIES